MTLQIDWCSSYRGTNSGMRNEKSLFSEPLSSNFPFLRTCDSKNYTFPA